MKVGMRIRELRTSQGFSQAELGRKVGLTQKAITSYERGTREPNLDTLMALVKALGTSLEGLIGEKGQKSEAMAKPRVAKNKRSVRVQELFDQLPPTEQRVVLKQIRGLIPRK